MDSEQLNKPLEEDVDLLSLEIKIGDALQLQDVDVDQQRHYVKLIGYLNQQYVIVTHPEKDGQPLSVYTGQTVLIRGFAERKTYEFHTSISDVCLNASPYLLLAFPNSITVITLRGALRIRQATRCSIRFDNDPLKQVAVIEDISTSGTKISAKQPLGEVGDGFTVNFRLEVDGVEVTYNIPAIIRNLQKEVELHNGEKCAMHGVQFMEMTGKERSFLQNYICKCIVETQ